ncbi:class II fructose-bisphosphate aldolase [[Clostridium] innocuum]|nr:class II fructose-bisphosphate aldolase [[Clostridium] innocuum]
MLVTMNELLKRAKQEGYAVPACNIDNEHNLCAAIEAAEETDTGIILNTTPVANPDLVTFGQLAVELARRSCVNIALNLDHGKSFADCLLGIRAGYTSIMIDRSLLPFEENVKQVKEMVRICHALGISVEAELGHVGVGEQYHTDGHQAFTRVEEAVEYVKQTGVDALAVAIGTAHGVYKGTPNIHFDLLHELKEALDIPLVLHGGSGTGDENLARCAREGINKVNLSNDLKRSAIENLIKEDLSGNAVYQLYPLLAEGFKNKIKHYIRLLGCEGK